jgi:hypothetical protein
MKKPKPQIIWATIAKKDGYGRYGDLYQAGEIVEVSLWRRILKQTMRTKTEKIIKLMEYQLPF